MLEDLDGDQDEKQQLVTSWAKLMVVLTEAVVGLALACFYTTRESSFLCPRFLQSDPGTSGASGFCAALKEASMTTRNGHSICVQRSGLLL